MTNLKSLKRALISSVVAILVCFTMLLGTTYAWFTDTATSTGNKIVAGTLDVQLLLYNEATGEYEDISANSAPIFGEAGLAQDDLNTLWEPGKTQVAYLAIKNNGSLDLDYTVNISVTSFTKNLYEVMQYAITPNAMGGSTAPAWTNGIDVIPGVNKTQAVDVQLGAGVTHYFALSVHMQENAGNEYQGGTVNFDINVLASQSASESDSFGNSYDENAGLPLVGTGFQEIDGSTSVYEFEVFDKDEADHNVQKVGNVLFPADAVADGADNVSVSITKEPSVNPNVTVNADQKATTYNVTATNVKEGNTAEITVAIRIGLGYTGVKVYHYGVLIPDDKVYYDGEYVHIKTTSFSPFTVVWDADAMILDPVNDVPVAIVDQVANERIEWKDYGNLSPAAGNNQQLDATFLFQAPHNNQTVQANIYKDWICDYFVTFKTAANTTLPEKTITLGGNYGEFGWIGFDNPEVKTNEAIPLLATFLGDYAETGELNEDWTYEAVVGFVKEFKCGVAKTVGTTYNFENCEFVVELRLVNPEDHTDYITVNAVVYDFTNNPAEIINYPNQLQ